MKLVFGNYESQLDIKKGWVNLVYSDSEIVFANMVQSAGQRFSEETIEPTYLIDGEKMTANDSAFFVGDICMLDLNDRKIISHAIKKLEIIVQQDERSKNVLEKRNAEVQESFFDVFQQLHGDYVFSSDWDLVKYIKASGFGIDQTAVVSLFDKLIHFINISIDLFSDVVLCFVNLKNYLNEPQYVQFYEMITAGSLSVLLYEFGKPDERVDFENYLFIDSNYIELCN